MQKPGHRDAPAGDPAASARLQRPSWREAGSPRGTPAQHIWQDAVPVSRIIIPGAAESCVYVTLWPCAPFLLCQEAPRLRVTLPHVTQASGDGSFSLGAPNQKGSWHLPQSHR